MTPRGLFPVPSRQDLGQRALGLPTVLVTNESSLSDGEDFTEGYRSLNLGKVVGTPHRRLDHLHLLPAPHRRLHRPRPRLAHPGHRAARTWRCTPAPSTSTVERPLGETETGADAQLEVAVKTLLSEK